MEGFSVTDEYNVQDLSAVVEERSLTPVAKAVKVRISKASSQTSKDGALKGIKLEVRIADGIEIVDQESGEVELKYINKPLFTGIMDLCYWADPAVKNSAWYKKNQHLVGLKQFCTALGIDLKSVVINDDLMINLVGQEVLIDISHEEETIVNPQTGERTKTGTLRERIRNWKKVA